MTFQTSLTGLNAANFQLSTSSNNIANADTNGFKRSRAAFETIYASSLQGANPADAGLGVRPTDPRQNFSQGALSSTGNILDLAITGEGFFPVKAQDNRDLFTREGGFRLNDAQYVVNGKGEFLQVAALDDKGKVIPDTLSSLRIPRQTVGQFRPSTRVLETVQLPADAPVITQPFSARDPKTYNHRTNVTLIDDSGQAHSGSVFYIKDRSADAADPYTQWKLVVEVDGQRLNPQPRDYRKYEAPTRSQTPDHIEWAGKGESTDILSLASRSQADTAPGALSVVDGQLWRGDGLVARAIGSVDRDKNGLGGQPLRINLQADDIAQGGPLSPASLEGLVSYSRQLRDAQGLVRIGTDGQLAPELSALSLSPSPGFSQGLSLDLSGSRQANVAFARTRLEQDGRPEGQLLDFRIGKDGLIQATYSNGHETALGKILLARFANASGLNQLGDARYTATTDSGTPGYGEPGQGLVGAVQSGALEKSNVDLMSEMVDLIMAQRNFQANAKAIESQSSMTQTLAENLR